MTRHHTQAMRAIILHTHGGPEQLVPAEISDPTPLPDEVVVDLTAAALNRRDVWQRAAPGNDGAVLGSDGAGRVSALGSDVTGVERGNEKEINPSVGWGDAEDAPAEGWAILGIPRQGTYAERIAIPAADVRPRPHELTWHESAALPLAGLPAGGALVPRPRRRGDRHLVQRPEDRALDRAGRRPRRPLYRPRLAGAGGRGRPGRGQRRRARVAGRARLPAPGRHPCQLRAHRRRVHGARDSAAVLRPVEPAGHDHGQPSRVRPAAGARAAGPVAPGRGQRVPAGRRGGSARAAGAAGPVRQGGAGMSLHLTQIRLSFGGDEVLSDVSAIVRPRDRVALVGRNGAAKTSLLRIIAGELEPEGGTMSLTGGTRVALHDQRPPLRRGITLGDYVGEGAAAAAELEADLRRIERRMAEGAGDDATLRDYGAAQAAFERAGGYAWRSRLEGIARGLGFSPQDLERQLDTFSGGE